MTETLAEKTLETALRGVAQRMQGSRALKRGDIVFRLSGPNKMALESDEGGVRVAPLGDRPRTPLIEVLGDAEAVRAVLAGEVDARRRFLAGGMRVRGDLRYLSDLAMELGLLKHPL